MVIAVDVLDYKLDIARKLRAVIINAAQEDPVAKVKELTEGRGVDAGIEAAGFEPTFRNCLESTRRGSRVPVFSRKSWRGA
jgi:threonine dehydrogenase-like Zn-dependent dehydrogenase